MPILSALLLIACPDPSVQSAAETNVSAPMQHIAEAPAVTPVTTNIIVPHDTPVELMAVSEVSTADVKPGAIFKLRVNRAVEIDGRVIVPIGATAFGTVVTATDSGGLGKSGRMTARLLHIQLGDAQIPIEGELTAKGTGAGSAGVAILFTGLAGFFHRGNNAKIKAGEILTAFVAEDVMLDMSAARVRRVGIVTQPPGQ